MGTAKKVKCLTCGYEWTHYTMDKHFPNRLKIFYPL